MLNAVAQSSNITTFAAPSNSFEPSQPQPLSTQLCSSQESNDSPHDPGSVVCNVELLPRSYGVLITLRQNLVPTDSAATSEKPEGSNTEVDHDTESEKGSLTSPSVVEDFLTTIAAYLRKQPVSEPANKTELETDIPSDVLSDPLLSKIFHFIEENYQQSISLSDVAQAIGYSPAYLTDLVRRQTGQPLHSWIIERRMTAARSLLLETDQSIAQIAVEVGYQDTGHFSRQFRQRHGIPPQAWRKVQKASAKT